MAELSIATIANKISFDFISFLRRREWHGGVVRHVKPVTVDVPGDIHIAALQFDGFAAFNRLSDAYFRANNPTRTTVGVNRLPTPIAIELKVIATIG